MQPAGRRRVWLYNIALLWCALVVSPGLSGEDIVSLDTTDAQPEVQELGSVISASHGSGSSIRGGGSAGGSAVTALRFTSTPFTEKRHGYADVVRYLKYLTTHPSKQNDLKIEQVTQLLDHKMDAVKEKIQAADAKIKESKHMMRLLREEKQGLKRSMDFTKATLERYQIKEKLQRLEQAIHHERTAQDLWVSKRSPLKLKLQKLSSQLKTKRFAFAEKGAKQQVKRLKKWAKQKVDFNMWRAKNTGPENKKFLRWKLTKKVRIRERMEKTHMEAIRQKLEHSLEAKVNRQFVNVKNEVQAVQHMTEGQGILARIKIEADKEEYKRKRDTNKDLDKSYQRLRNKFDKDTENSGKITADLQTVGMGQTRRMESGAAKQNRRNNLAKARAIAKRAMRNRRLKIPQVVDPKLAAKYFLFKSENADPKVLKQAARDLDLKVVQAKAQDKLFVKQRKAATSVVASRAYGDESRAQKLSGLKIRAIEMKEKSSAIKKLQVLHAKLKKLKNTPAGKAIGVKKSPLARASEESKDNELAEKTKVAKAEFLQAKQAADQAQAAHKAIKPPSAAKAKSPKAAPA